MKMSQTKPTAQRCDCHGSETLAKTHPELGVLEIRDRRHGTFHSLSFTLEGIVSLLDPYGTSFTAVSSST